MSSIAQHKKHKGASSSSSSSLHLKSSRLTLLSDILRVFINHFNSAINGATSSSNVVQLKLGLCLFPGTNRSKYYIRILPFNLIISCF